jgi:hypothetical protein
MTIKNLTAQTAAIAAAGLLIATAHSGADTFNLSKKKIGADGVAFIPGSAGHNLRLEDPEIVVGEGSEGAGTALIFSGAQLKPGLLSFGESANSASVHMKILPSKSAGDTDESILVHPGNFELRRSPKRGEATLFVNHRENEPPVLVKAPLPAGKWSTVDILISGQEIKLEVDGKAVTEKLPDGATMAGAKSFFRIGATQDGKRPFTGQISELTISEPAD